MYVFNSRKADITIQGHVSLFMWLGILLPQILIFFLGPVSSLLGNNAMGDCYPMKIFLRNGQAHWAWLFRVWPLSCGLVCWWKDGMYSVGTERTSRVGSLWVTRNFATLFHVVLLFICLFQVTHFLLEFVDVAAEAHGMPIPALSST